MQERDVPEADGRDERHRWMPLIGKAKTGGLSRLNVFPSRGYPSVPFAVSKTDVPETDGPETDVPETDAPETEEGRDGGPQDVGRPRWMSPGWMSPRLKMCFLNLYVTF